MAYLLFVVHAPRIIFWLDRIPKFNALITQLARMVHVIVKCSSNISWGTIEDKIHQRLDRYGFSIRTLEKWEQGSREPDGAAWVQ
jgi:hypothetical protein